MRKKRRNSSWPFIHPRAFYGLLLFCGLSACQHEDAPLFETLPAEQTGIHFSNRITENDTFNILNYEYTYNGGGVAIADFNQDGKQDVFFSGNMVDNALYLNQGGFQFEEVTEMAGVAGKGKWNSGVTVVDINTDGWPDLYVCSTTREPAHRRANLLYINQAKGKGQPPVFKEMAAAYGIADTSHTTTAAFLDYDNDGDLDVFLAVNQMDHRHTPNFYRKKVIDGSSIRTDKLLRNDFNAGKGHPVFTDVSREAGILIEGFSLGVNVVDINRDGWKDIYVTNDYLSNDLFYINNGDGTFTDQAATIFKHTCHSAMGNDVVDLNNDGWPEVVALDMLPEDNFRRKTMMPPNNYTSYLNNARYGYQHQYIRNTLQLNNGLQAGTEQVLFSDVSMLAGMSATDWSWAPLIADFDNDGDRDLIVTNGFPKDVTDRDFIDYNDEFSRYEAKDRLLKKIPSIKIKNYAFENQVVGRTSDSRLPIFKKVTREWGITQPSFSNGAAWADLDDDGDLDYIVNNINDSAFIYRNQLIERQLEASNWLKVKFVGSAQNPEGQGARIELFYDNGKMQAWENTPYRGYLSSVESGAHFGLGKTAQLDSLLVYWPDGKWQSLPLVVANQTLELNIKKASSPRPEKTKLANALFQEINEAVGLDYLHPESDYIDFNVQRTLLHKLSQYGPGIAVSDINGDGLDDFYLGGSHFNKGTFFLQQTDGSFQLNDLLPGENGDAKKTEELGVLFFDADQDGDEDLYLVSGGYEFAISDSAYRDRLYMNEEGTFVEAKDALPSILSSGSCVKAADFDRDGDLDLFVGGRVLPTEYPLPVSSYLLRNDGKGHFSNANAEVAPELEKIGMVCDALWTDYDNDGWTDLLLAGEWMPLQFLKNKEGQLALHSTSNLEGASGWWNSLVAADFDLDGDMDYVAGNLGLNTFLKNHGTDPLRLYYADFDGNKGLDLIPAAFFPNQQDELVSFPYFSRMDMEKQIIKVRAFYPRHAQYATASSKEIVDQFAEVPAQELKAHELRTCYIENKGDGTFDLHELPIEAQTAPVYGLLSGDFNGDHLPDVLLSGNDYGMEVSTGRYDAFNGLLLLGNGDGTFRSTSMQESGISIPGDGKSLASLQGADGSQLVVAGQNRGPVKLFQKEKKGERSIALKATDQAAIIQLANGSSYKEEFHYSHSFLAQSARRLWLPAAAQTVELIDFQGNKRKVETTNLKSLQ